MNNKKIIGIFFTMCTLLLLVVSCAPQTTQPASTDDIDQELSQMSEQELEETAKSKSTPSSIAGQAFRKTKGEITISRDEYTKLKASQYLTERYTQSSKSVEICNDNKDNDGNNLIDCNDILSCYSPQSASKNICTGSTGTVLLNGLSLGYNAQRTIKADKTTNTPYSDGNTACILTFGEQTPCLAIESYQNKQWITISNEQVSCSTEISAIPTLSDTYYRAVCVQGTVIPPGPPTVSGGILSK